MPELERSLADAGETGAFGRRLAAELVAGDALLLSGALGAGKTTLVRGLLAGLGWAGDVPSPSFALVQPYEPPTVRLPLWHVDLYRLEQPEEVDELGLGEVLADGVLAVEWPERLAGRPIAPALHLTLRAQGDRRFLTVMGGPAWADRWPFR